MELYEVHEMMIQESEDKLQSTYPITVVNCKIDSALPNVPVMMSNNTPYSNPICDSVPIESEFGKCDLQPCTASKSSVLTRLLLLLLEVIMSPICHILLVILIDELIFHLIHIGGVEHRNITTSTSHHTCIYYQILLVIVLEACTIFVLIQLRNILAADVDIIRDILKASDRDRKLLDTSSVLELMKSLQPDKEIIEHCRSSDEDHIISERKVTMEKVLFSDAPLEEEELFDCHPNLENAIALFRGGSQIFSTDNDSSGSDDDIDPNSMPGDTTSSNGETYIPSPPEQNRTHSRMNTSDVQPSGTGEAERRVHTCTPQTPTALAKKQNPQKDTIDCRKGEMRPPSTQPHTREPEEVVQLSGHRGEILPRQLIEEHKEHTPETVLSSRYLSSISGQGIKAFGGNVEIQKSIRQPSNDHKGMFMATTRQLRGLMKHIRFRLHRARHKLWCRNLFGREIGLIRQTLLDVVGEMRCILARWNTSKAQLQRIKALLLHDSPRESARRYRQQQTSLIIHTHASLICLCPRLDRINDMVKTLIEQIQAANEAAFFAQLPFQPAIVPLPVAGPGNVQAIQEQAEPQRNDSLVNP